MIAPHLSKWPWHDLRWWWTVLPTVIVLAALAGGQLPIVSNWSLEVLRQLLQGLGAYKVVESIVKTIKQPPLPPEPPPLSFELPKQDHV